MDAGTGERIRILLVDDDEDIRFLAQSALEIDGRFCIVGVGANGAEAIQLAREHQPDLVLLDLEMPWLDGAEALPHIRHGAPRAVVVVWTVDPHGRRAGDAVALGASVVLDKALIGATALAGRLCAVLSHESARTAVPPAASRPPSRTW